MLILDPRSTRNQLQRYIVTMRLPYVRDPPPTATEDEAKILASVQARRAPNPLLPLDLALLHSFSVADGWNSFIGAIRTRTSLSTVVRELAICRVAVVNGALFEWEQHAPLLQEGGLSEEALQVVGDAKTDFSGEVAEKALTREQRAVLKYTDAMTKTVTVPDEVFRELKDCFNEKEVVEITATVAAYNCVSRFLVALDVGEKNH
jgi:alkylhydroperoxidase family enzyme